MILWNLCCRGRGQRRNRRNYNVSDRRRGRLGTQGGSASATPSGGNRVSAATGGSRGAYFIFIAGGGGGGGGLNAGAAGAGGAGAGPGTGTAFGGNTSSQPIGGTGGAAGSGSAESPGRFRIGNLDARNLRRGRRWRRGGGDTVGTGGRGGDGCVQGPPGAAAGGRLGPVAPAETGRRGEFS